MDKIVKYYKNDIDICLNERSVFEEKTDTDLQDKVHDYVPMWWYIVHTYMYHMYLCTTMLYHTDCISYVLVV